MNSIRSVSDSQGVAAATQPTAAAAAPSSSSASVDAAVSDPAKVLDKLTSLATTDPSAFKQTTADIASKLGDAAKATSDPQQQSAINSVAAKFTAASQSGSAADLPTPPTKVSAKVRAYDVSHPADKNKDGSVSMKEQRAYAAAHAKKQAAAQSYTASASASAAEKVSDVLSNVASKI